MLRGWAAWSVAMGLAAALAMGLGAWARRQEAADDAAAGIGQDGDAADTTAPRPADIVWTVRGYDASGPPTPADHSVRVLDIHQIVWLPQEQKVVIWIGAPWSQQLVVVDGTHAQWTQLWLETLRSILGPVGFRDLTAVGG